jgi:hypothetical protein
MRYVECGVEGSCLRFCSRAWNVWPMHDGTVVRILNAARLLKSWSAAVWWGWEMSWDGMGKLSGCFGERPG